MSNRKVTFDVYITNLPDDIDEESLKQEFAACGGVQSVTIKDGKNNSARFGFVRYFKEDAQEAAASQLNGKYIKGKVVVVRKADYKKRTSSSEGNNCENKRQQRGDSQQANGPRQSDPQKTSAEYIEQAILITYVVDACTVFAQLAHRDMAEVSAKLMVEINQYCPVAQMQGPEQPDLNKVYGALFSEDGMWYRCKVAPSLEGSPQQNPTVRVHYLDYGNDEVVDSNSLVELPMSLASLAPQAHMLVFRGIKPTAQTVDENRKAVEFLQGATECKSVMARLYRPLQTTSSSTPVEIYDGTSGLNDVLIQKGFAVKFPPASPRPLTNIDASPAARSPSPSKGNPTSGSHAPKGSPTGGRGLLETPPMQPINKRSTNVSKTSGYQTAGPGGVNAEQYQSEIQALKIEMMHLKTDKAELVKKCQECINEVSRVQDEKNNLRTEFQSVKEAATNTLSCLQKFEEKYKTSMQTKVTNLLQTLATLKQIRKQVVIDPDVRDPVENAIALLTDSTDAFVSLRDGIDEESVQTAHTELCQHQAKFYEPEAKIHLDELISARDKVRQRTYEVMSSFLDVVECLPLAEKKAKIESSLKELENTFQHLLYGVTNTSLTGRGDGDRDQVNICVNYKEWKYNKGQQLKTLRETTDELAAQWRQAVQENLVDPFDLTSDLGNQSGLAFDDLARHFIVAMETEIAMTGQDEVNLKVDPALLEKKKEEEGQKAAILYNTVRVVVRQLHQELEAIDYISSRNVAYSTTRNDLEKWLNTKPDVSALQAVQKVIKGIKSKLRHKLADKDDLEEDPELNSGGELQKIEQELASIRLELQKAYVEEDKLMEDVTELSRVHFPELSHQYPSFDIEHYLDTLGLVKRGRDLQQFDLKSLPGCDKKMIHLGQYNGKPVVIKSFFIPDDAARQEFLIQSVKALTLGYEGRLIADAVYAPSNLGEVHVLLPYIEMGSLESAIAKEGIFASKPLTDQELQFIFSDVLTGISRLQEHGTATVHGAIHPRNVLLTSRTSALLAEYNNATTPTHRAQQAYVSKNGLGFCPPEVNSGLPASPVWDMYSFGVLLLWAHYPEVAFPVLLNGTPDLTVVEMKPFLKEAISSLLSHVHKKRPNAEEAMRMDFFIVSSQKEENEETAEGEVAGSESETEDAVVMEKGGDAEADVPMNVTVITKDEQLGEKTESLKDEQSETKEDGDGATKGQEQKTDAEDEVKVLEDKKVEVVVMQTHQVKPDVSSPTSRSLLLKKMVAAMVTNGESAKEEASTMPEGSEI